ncbi:MAG: hypothetical protein F6K10_02190 [Moorea sp. SIO2B7]|nr:hypothetical protein [Moorena sp. SIO2B7]
MHCREQELPQIQQLVEQQPSALLKELCQRWTKRSGIEVSVPTMCRTVRKLGLTRKKNTLCQ